MCPPAAAPPPRTLRELVADPSKAPRTFHSAADFVDALLVGKHVDELLVLRGGLRALGLDRSIRRDVLSAAQQSDSLSEFADRLGGRALDTLDGRVYYWTAGGRERTLKRDRDGNLFRSVGDKLRAATELADDGAPPASTPAEGAAVGLAATGSLYIAELAHLRRRRHPASPWERSRTLSACDVQDAVPHGGGRYVPSWDRGHAFVGGEGAGSSVHVDQVCWSNVGKNFAGRKLLAIWALGGETDRILSRWYRSLLRPDAESALLPPDAAADLARASRLAIVEPGDVFVFSGANAHATLVLQDSRDALSTPAPPPPPPVAPPAARRGGRSVAAAAPSPSARRASLNLTSYESFLNFNEENLRAFLNTGTAAHHGECQMREDDLADFKADVAERLHAALEWVGERVGHAAPTAWPPPARATRAGRALARRMRGAVLAAVRLLRTDGEVDRCMRALEGGADGAGADAPRRALGPDRDDDARGSDSEPRTPPAADGDWAAATTEERASVGLLPRRGDGCEAFGGGGDELWSH